MSVYTEKGILYWLDSLREEYEGNQNQITMETKS